MTTQQLQCFLQVADRLNFTKAAEDLYLSVPTVTHHIQNLENELGTKLLIRTSRKVQLTPAGVSFYQDASEIYGKIQIAAKRLHNLERKGVQVLRIGCVTNAELDKLAEPLKKLHKEFPQCLPQLIVDDYFKLEKMFENKQLDIMIGTRAMTEDLTSGQFLPICKVSEFAVMSQEVFAEVFPDVFSDVSIDPDTLSQKAPDTLENSVPSFHLDHTFDYPLITLHQRLLPFRANNKFQQEIMTYIHSHIHLSCENDKAALLLAQSGYGIAILPEFYLPWHLDNLKVLSITGTQFQDYGFMIQEKSEPVEYLVKEYQANDPFRSMRSI